MCCGLVICTVGGQRRCVTSDPNEYHILPQLIFCPQTISLRLSAFTDFPSFFLLFIYLFIYVLLFLFYFIDLFIGCKIYIYVFFLCGMSSQIGPFSTFDNQYVQITWPLDANKYFFCCCDHSNDHQISQHGFSAKKEKKLSLTDYTQNITYSFLPGHLSKTALEKILLIINNSSGTLTVSLKVKGGYLIRVSHSNNLTIIIESITYNCDKSVVTVKIGTNDLIWGISDRYLDSSDARCGERRRVLLSFLVTVCECFQRVLTNLGYFPILLRQVLICCHMPGNLCYFWLSDCSMVGLSAESDSELTFLFFSHLEQRLALVEGGSFSSCEIKKGPIFDENGNSEVDWLGSNQSLESSGRSALKQAAEILKSLRNWHNLLSKASPVTMVPQVDYSHPRITEAVQFNCNELDFGMLDGSALRRWELLRSTAIAWMQGGRYNDLVFNKMEGWKYLLKCKLFYKPSWQLEDQIHHTWFVSLSTTISGPWVTWRTLFDQASTYPFQRETPTNESLTFEIQSLLSQNQLSNSFLFRLSSTQYQSIKVPSFSTSSNPSIKSLDIRTDQSID
ncbi:hypothetical protein VP01_2166g1 [Puccinia sorghi]|uniref:Uncharacterized protein n=1 Tax=Puccinia sorghi TaxID=27349 RepID=A0A0L6V9N9_9BASI|nr:hypothetical protein VP01_2166g1 [Puccinia sorghi]